MKKKNYLNNKDILKEIHKSKNTFNSYAKPEHHQFDLILHSIDDIDDAAIEQAKLNRAKRESVDDYDARKAAEEPVKQADCEVDPEIYGKEDVIFRIMTFDHIPDELDRKKKHKTVADSKIKLNFPPFQHYKYLNNKLTCVGKSHWCGDVNDGYFMKEKGKATDKLAMMWLKLVDRYATRGNVRGYTYNDEMKGQAILQLAQIGLQFDESKSNNPFAYYTAAVTNSFVRVINIEKKNQNIRDDILEMNDLSPSYTRLHNSEWATDVKRNQDS